jgi:hypothetical protein
MHDGCLSCGAYSVGEPLPRPERELPSYARSLVLTVTGTLMVLVFSVETIVALAARATRGATSNLAAFSMIPLDFWSLVAAAETAAWRLKWVMIPVTLLVVFVSRRIYRSMQVEPARFCGQRIALRGYVASLAIPLLVLILIGVTVPERLHQRQLGIRAGINANIYRTDRALVEYRAKFGTLPSDLKDLSRLPDADGSLAAALKNIDASGYTVNSEVAAVPTKKPRPLRGAVILNASVAPAGDDALSGGLSFTNYELPLAGPDNLKGTEDDLIVRDGVMFKVSELPRRGPSTNSATQPRRP